MSGSSDFVAKWNTFRGKVSPVYKKVKEVIGLILKVIFKLRKVFMAVPVVYLAVKLAMDNAERLPELVGFNLQTTGEFAVMVGHNYAVYGPLVLTGFCLLLMFCSKKTLFPWVISIFSLVVPYLIYLSNLFGNNLM